MLESSNLDQVKYADLPSLVNQELIYRFQPDGKILQEAVVVLRRIVRNDTCIVEIIQFTLVEENSLGVIGNLIITGPQNLYKDNKVPEDPE